MSDNREPGPPYFDWSLDQWKVLAIVILFVTLLIGTAIGPGADAAHSTAQGPAMSDAGSAIHVEWSADSVNDDGITASGVASASSAAPGDPEPSVDSAGSEVLPLTLASLGPNTVISAVGVAALSGTGNRAGRIEVRDQLIRHTDVSSAPIPSSNESLLGVASVDERGLWTLPLEDVLAPGQHILSMREVDADGNILSVSAPSIVLVLDRGEQGPPSLATPLIRFPAPAARLRAGSIGFLGSGMPGMRVRLYLNGAEAAEGVVNSREEWRLTPADELLPGVYVAHVESYDPEDILVAESPPIAFSVVEPVEEMSVAP